MNKKEEEILRESIRHMIRHVKQKRSGEEQQLREVIRSFIDIELESLKEAQTPDNSPTPNKSTGINVLEDLLKKIIPVLETDYKLLTTSSEQRKSFRSHVIQAVVGTLTPAITNNEADDEVDQLKKLKLMLVMKVVKTENLLTFAQMQKKQPMMSKKKRIQSTLLESKVKMKLVATWLIKASRKLKLV